MKASRKCVLPASALDDQNYILQSCSNVTLKPELELTVIACLAGRDSQEVLYTGFVQTLSGDSKRTRFLPDICNANIHKNAFSAKNIYRLEWTIVASKSRVCKERAEALVKKTIRWAFWQLFIILLSLFVSQVTGDCSVLCDHSVWWGKTKGLVYSHETDYCLS